MKVLIVILVFIVNVQADFRINNWRNDKWNTQSGAYIKYDKAEHFVGSFILTGALKPISPKYNWAISFSLHLIYEFKDALCHNEDFGKWGGEGFSAKDLLAGVGGIILWEIVYYAGKQTIKLYRLIKVAWR